MRVLLTEDDVNLADNLKTLLEAQHFSVDVAYDGVEGLYQICEFPYDMAIIDIGLPKKDGMSLIREARAKGIDIPVLILTARDRWQEKVEGLDAGADDYLTKPFHNEELLARCNALIRRNSGQSNPELKAGPLALNTPHPASMRQRPAGYPHRL